MKLDVELDTPQNASADANVDWARIWVDSLIAHDREPLPIPVHLRRLKDDRLPRRSGPQSSVLGHVGPRTRTILAYIIPMLLVALSTFTWFDAGTFVASGDTGPFYRTSTLAESTHVWGYTNTGEGSPTAEAPRLFEATTARLVRSIGGSPQAAQQVFYALLLALAVAGLTFCFRQLVVESTLAPPIASVLAIANPAALSHMPNPLIPATLASVGFAAGVILRASRNLPTPIGLVALASLPAAYVALNAAFLVVVGVGCALALGVALTLYGRKGVLLSLSAIRSAAPLVLLLHAWWILPWIISLVSNRDLMAAETSVQEWAFTHANSSLDRVVTLTSHWGWDIYLPWALQFDEWPLVATKWFFPVVALSAPFIATTRTLRKLTGWIIVAAVVLAFVAKGTHAPLSGVSLWAFDHIPGLWLWREPGSKAGLLLAICFAANTGIAINGLLSRAARWTTSRHSMWIAVTYLVIGIASAGSPLFTGDVAQRGGAVIPSSRVHVPEEWSQLADDLNATPPQGKVLVLPTAGFYQMTTKWGYHGVADLPRQLIRRPVILSLPGGYYRSTRAYDATLREFERRVLKRQFKGLERMLDALGVSHIIIRHDFVRNQIAAKQPADSRVLETALASSGMFDDSRSYDPIATVFRKHTPAPMVQAFSAVAIDSPGSPERVARLLTTLPPQTAVVTEAEASQTPPFATASHPASIRVLGAGRESYRIRVDISTQSSFVIALAEAADFGWRLKGLPDGATVQKVTLDGYRQGWLITSPHSFEARIAYWPGRLLRMAQVGAFLALLATIGSLLTSILGKSNRWWTLAAKLRVSLQTAPQKRSSANTPIRLASEDRTFQP